MCSFIVSFKNFVLVIILLVIILLCLIVDGKTNCELGSVLYEGTLSCVKCPIGKIEDEGKCIKCPFGKYASVEGSKICSACPSNASSSLYDSCTINRNCLNTVPIYYINLDKSKGITILIAH